MKKQKKRMTKKEKEAMEADEEGLCKDIGEDLDQDAFNDLMDELRDIGR